MPRSPRRSMAVALLRLAPLAALFLSASTARADEPPRPDMLVADLGQHVVGVGYQRSISPYLAGQIAASYYQPWTQNINFLGLSGDAHKGGDLRGAILRGRVFIHPFGAAPSGLWVSPFVQAGVGWGLRNGERRAGPLSAAGVSIGYSGMITKSVLVGGGLGIQYHAARIAGGDAPPSFSRFYPQVEIQLGYVF